MSELASSVNQSVDMATAYEDVMRSFQPSERGHDLIDSEKLKTSLAVKGAMVAQQHAFDAHLLQHFHEHMKAMSQIHDDDIQKVDESLAELSSKVESIAKVEPVAPTPVPPVQDGQMDPQMVAAMLELQQFAQQIRDAGGIDNIASISAAIQAAGGVQQFNSQLAQVNALSSAAGGPQQLASHFQVVSQVARSAGGVSQLADILQQVKELCIACNGPAECGNMLQVAQDVVSAAGGASQFVDLLKQMKALLDSSQGPVSLVELLGRMAALCDSCGGNDQLASLLNATSDLTTAFGGASNAQDIMSKLSALVDSFGGKDALVAIMKSLSDLLDRLGGVDGLYELLARHKQLLDRTADLDSLYAQLKELSGNTGGLSPEDQKLLKDMEKRVEQLEKEVNGFNDTIEELRAAGRVEAMEDLMSSLMTNLKESEKGKNAAMAEAKAARQEARKMRSMKQESLASATSMPATLSSLGSTREFFMARAASGVDKLLQQESGGSPGPGEAHLELAHSNSRLGTPDAKTEDKVGTQLVSALASAGSRGTGRAAKSQRFAPESMAGLSPVPETSPAAVPDGCSAAVHDPATQTQDAGGPDPAGSARDPAVTAAAGAQPSGGTGASTQDSQAQLEHMTLSPVGSSASLHAAMPSKPEQGRASGPSAAVGRDVDAQQGKGSTFGAGSGFETSVEVGGAGAGSELEHSSPDKPSQASGLFGKFKAKAAEIVQEQRLGNVKRFASQALTDTMAKVEQPVAEVLKHLTSIQPPAHVGPDQDDIDALQDEILEHTVRINDLDALVARLDEIKANKDAIKRLYSILEEVWSAVQQIQGPEGDEARGIKQLQGKCISCDRPLNVQRQNRLGDLPSSMDAFSTHKSRPKGPGWESAPNRALGNGDVETAAELRRRAKSPPRGTQDGGLPAHFQPDQKRPSTTPAFAERPTRHAPGSSVSHQGGASVNIAERRRATAGLPFASPSSTSVSADRRHAGSVSPAAPSAPPSHSVTKNLGKAREKQLEQLKASGEMTFKSERIGDSTAHGIRR